MKKREETAIKDTWKMEDMFPSLEAWSDLYQKTLESLSEYGEYKGHLAESAHVLRRCLTFDDTCSLNIERLFVYARQRSDEDTGNQVFQDYASRAQTLSNKAASLSSYIVPEILGMEECVLRQFMKTDPKLLRFKRSIQLIIQKRAHTLSAEMEELLAESYEATQGANQIFSMFNNADITFPTITDGEGQPVTITHGNFIALLESSDRRVREDAFHALYRSYGEFKNTLAATFSANIKQAVFYAKARHYSSSRSYYLSGNEIPEEVYDNLITTVRQHLPLLHRYVSVRKQALGLDQLHMYDLYTPMVSEADKKVPYEEAKTIVKSGLAPLGEEYLRILQEGFDHRWIDVYENKGKRSGAYSWGAYGTHPYVLLNYNGTLDHVFTLAHEMGHAIHSYFSDSSQSFADAGYKIFVAEVASTCNEALLIRHLLSETENRKERAYLLNHFMESFRGTVFRQTMFAEFELLVHRKAEAGETLTAESLCQIYRQLNLDYFGSDMVVDEDIDLEWARIPHFYTPFYVYQYATGFSAAIAVSSKILAGDSQVLEGYLRFLSGGNSMPPIELLRLCSVDMSKPDPIKEALQVFERLLDEFLTCVS